jgi:glycosyltransferase involved in cell wall biosynthesis
MKLIVQVPCFNEENTLASVINSIPKHIYGIDQVETMVVDDGSKDKTVEVAKSLGVDHIIQHNKNKGLASTFADGIDAGLKFGADIIVNTDGDNQYPQADLPKLIRPILRGTHDIVIGDRQTDRVADFSFTKKLFQKIGSKVVQMAAGIDVEDAPSGFRAYSREAALHLNIVTNFSYTMETIISAGKNKLAITHVPVITNPKTRESRLFKNIFQHIRKSAMAIFRSYTMHEPLKVFATGGLFIFFIGLIPYVRLAYVMLTRNELIGGHIQSLIVGGVIMILGVIVAFLGIVADLLRINRKILEDALYRVKRMELGEDETQ